MKLLRTKDWNSGFLNAMRKGFKLLLLAVMIAGPAAASGPRVPDDMISIRSALQMFKINAGRYPTEEEGLMALVERPATYPADKRWQQLMDKLPSDPWGHPYRYVVSADFKASPDSPSLAPAGLGLYSQGPDGITHSKGNDPDDWNSWSGGSWKKSPWRGDPAVRSAGVVILALIVVIALIRCWRGGAAPEETGGV